MIYSYKLFKKKHHSLNNDLICINYLKKISQLK